MVNGLNGNYRCGFFGKDGVGKIDTSPLKENIHWGLQNKTKVFTSYSLGSTWFTILRIMAFGRGEGGKSLFRKTFGSLEKPSQRL